MTMIRSLLSRLFGDVAFPGTLDPKWALFSANSFIAAMLATYLAFRLGLQRPSWAMLTVYLTAQPFAGAVRSRAVYRLLGTLLGACAALALVPILADQPALMCLAITSWAALCLYISLQDRTPRSYAFMLAGYTATTVAFSSVTAPDLVFGTALARVEEIALGICCATIVHTLLFPRDVTSTLTRSIDAAARDAFAWTADVLLDRTPTRSGSARWQLAADLTQFEIMSTHLRYDTAARKPESGAIRAIQDRLAFVLPMLTAIEDRLAALGDRRMPEFDQLLAQVGEWARDPGRSKLDKDELLRRCAKLEATLPASQGEWDRLLATSTIAKSVALIEALAAIRELSAIIHGSEAGLGLATASRLRVGGANIHRARRNLHLDQGIAALSVVAFFAAVLGCSAVWIATAWPEGSVAAQIAAIGAALYSSLDDPAPSLVTFAVWCVGSLVLAAFYLFVIFPAIDGFSMLVASLAPSLLVLGYLQANPRHFLKALALILGLIAALELQNKFSADFASFLNVNSAAIIGVLAAYVAVRTFRSVTAKRAARRLLRHGWVDLAILAGARRPMNLDRWLGVMLDRLGLVIPRLTLSGADVSAEAGRSLAALQIGLDMLDLKSSVANGNERPCSNVDRLTPELTRAFRWFAAGNNALRPVDAQALLAAIDAVLRERDTGAPARQRTRLIALVGLRRTLFPDAPSPTFDGATP